MQSPLIRAGNNTFSHTVHQLEHNPPDTLNPSYRFALVTLFNIVRVHRKNAGTTESPWRIKKICGAFGTALTEKVTLVTEANMFNEIF